MPESETSICNKALTALGANTIIALTDKTHEALVCKEHYEACRDAVLEDDDWSFAIQTVKVSSPVTDTTSSTGFGTVESQYYSNAFLIPPDLLRVLEVNRNERDWVIEGQYIWTNDGEIVIRGIYRVTDPSRFPPRFVQALVFLLAANICLPITESPVRMDAMMGRYGYEKVRARSNDGRQGRNRRRFVTTRR